MLLTYELGERPRSPNHRFQQGSRGKIELESVCTVELIALPDFFPFRDFGRTSPRNSFRLDSPFLYTLTRSGLRHLYSQTDELFMLQEIVYEH